MWSASRDFVVILTTAEEVGFEPTVGCPTHDFQSCRFGRSRTPPEGPDAIVSPSSAPSSAAAGFCATGPREPSQGRKTAALSGQPRVPQATWPLRPGAHSTFGGGRTSAAVASSACRLPTDPTGAIRPGSALPVPLPALPSPAVRRGPRARPRHPGAHERRRDGHVAHAYLFSGPRGTGKTSTARGSSRKRSTATAPDGASPAGRANRASRSPPAPRSTSTSSTPPRTTASTRCATSSPAPRSRRPDAGRSTSSTRSTCSRLRRRTRC